MGATTVFAQEAAAEESCSRAPRSYGWSVIAVGLATPVQIPWGLNKWDIFGLDLNLGYSDAPKMYGWEFALGANTARQRMVGLQTAIGFNYTAEDAYGMAVSLFNMNRCKAYGLSVDAVGFNNNVYGLEANLVGAFTKKNFGGLQVSGLTSIVGDNLYGAQLAVGQRHLVGVGKRFSSRRKNVADTAEDVQSLGAGGAKHGARQVGLVGLALALRLACDVRPGDHAAGLVRRYGADASAARCRCLFHVRVPFGLLVR
jgi:hypothetical protein